MELPEQDPESPLFGMWPNPMDMTDKVQITFHCHRPTLMEAMSACMNFVAEHDLDTPDVNADYSSVINPNNGKTIEWYEATVSAVLKDGSSVAVNQPKE